MNANTRIWTGRVLTGLLVAFLLFDASCKLLRLPMVVEASEKLGFSESSIFGIGLVLFLTVVIHLIPRTAVLGAVLVTGYLGGAICTHVRSGDGPFSIVFAAACGALIWLGLYLRDDRVRMLVASAVTPRSSPRAHAAR
jgi:hypothetical protein